MATGHAGSQVDYRHRWRTIGELKPNSRSVQIPVQANNITHNKCEALAGELVEQRSGELECEKLCDDNFPIRVAVSNFPPNTAHA